MFRDEGPYLIEWIEYHLLAGVSRFWLYDNGSADDGAAKLAPYVARGVVELTPWPTADNPPRRRERIERQLGAAKDGFRRASGVVDWVAHVDVDEFFLPTEDRDVPTCLEKRFAEASGVYVNWRMFGTSGVTVPAGDPILGALTRCARRGHPENSVGKSARAWSGRSTWTSERSGTCTTSRCGPRAGYYVDGAGRRLSFDARSDLVKSPDHLDDHLRINHYNLRDEHFYRTRRLPDAEKGRLDKKLDRLVEHHADFSRDTDTKIVKYLKRYHSAAYRQRWA